MTTAESAVITTAPRPIDVAVETLIYLAKHAADEQVRLDAAVRLIELTC